jgi:hypothetical protein
MKTFCTIPSVSIVVIIIAIFVLSISANAQQPILDVGLRFQKTVNLYQENGFTIQYSDARLKYDKLYFGISYYSSRLGTAFQSNAIKHDNFLLSVSYFFRKDKLIRPLTRLNLGYFTADYEYVIFDDLQSNSLLLSPEFGISVNLKQLPLKIATSLGYNVITGDGVNGAGTLYPLFIQTSVTWSISKK